MEEVNANTIRDIVITEKIDCKLCDEPGDVLYEKLNDVLFGVSGQWSLRQCKACELIWLNEQPKVDEIYKLYSSYHTHDVPNIKFTKGIKKIKWTVRKWILGFSNNYRVSALQKFFGFFFSLIPGIKEDARQASMWIAGPQGKLLDVGCGNGIFLKKMEQLGWAGHGVEFDSNSVKQAKNIGLDVLTGSLEQAEYPANSFDLITLNHVIEHLPDPVSTLKECYRVLKPGGQLMMVTPNINSLGHSMFKQAWRGLEIPRHLNMFSIKSLSEVVTRAGFEIYKANSLSRSAFYMYVHSLETKWKLQNKKNFVAKKHFWNARFFKLEENKAMKKAHSGEELYLLAVKA